MGNGELWVTLGRTLMDNGARNPQGIRRAAGASADNKHKQQEQEPKRADEKLTDSNQIGQNTECLADGMGVDSNLKDRVRGLRRSRGSTRRVYPGLVFWIHGGRDPVSANESALR
ncbi:hypothetical protein NEUTE2DRAFT_52199 [Neurospora tetrasperma FGSC 2509]|nr:hypothetical protein NEUTE2DRAFT_52199 [Neurospora tetrasperma FGSC 2509]